MPGRESDRTKHRTPCTISIGAQRHNGLVIDFSRSGLFIQTSAKPDIGARLDVEMVIHGGPQRLQVEVARRKQVPPQLRTVAHGGIGVRILTAPEEFYQLLAGAQGSESGSASARSTPTAPARRAATPARPGRAARGNPGPRARVQGRGATPQPVSAAIEYRVRVKEVAGSRTRTLTVLGSDEASAREEVAEDLGDEWKVLDITPV